MVQITMPKPYIKYKIISSSRSGDICYEIFIMENMKNSKSHGKQEVDVQYTWKGETRYKSPYQSHISNIKSFLPVFFFFCLYYPPLDWCTYIQLQSQILGKKLNKIIKTSSSTFLSQLYGVYHNVKHSIIFWYSSLFY